MMIRALLFILLGSIVAGFTIIRAQEPDKGTEFTVLQRAEVPGAPDLEIVMGVVERKETSTSSKHYHSGGELGFVVEGAVTIRTEDHGPVALEAGASFYQAPGEWHVVSTSESGAKTVLIRILKKGDPAIVEVD